MQKRDLGMVTTLFGHKHFKLKHKMRNFSQKKSTEFDIDILNEIASFVILHQKCGFVLKKIAVVTKQCY